MSSRCSWLVVDAIVLFLSLVFVVAGDDSPTCEIPLGSFDGMYFDSQLKQPYYGNLCVASDEPNQVRVYTCVKRCCYSTPCSCDTNSQDQNTCDNNSTVTTLSCYGLETKVQGHRYTCCEGSYEDEFHVCISRVNCSLSYNGGCNSNLICRHNFTTGLDYCDCPEGFNKTLIDKNGTEICAGHGPGPAADTSMSRPTATTNTTSGVNTSPDDKPNTGLIVLGVLLGVSVLLNIGVIITLCIIGKRKPVEQRKETESNYQDLQNMEVANNTDVSHYTELQRENDNQSLPPVRSDR